MGLKSSVISEPTLNSKLENIFIKLLFYFLQQNQREIFHIPHKSRIPFNSTALESHEISSQHSNIHTAISPSAVI